MQPKTHRNVAGPNGHRSPFALLLIDVINDLEFEEGDLLLQSALPMAERIGELKAYCHRQDIPVIYVNDNFGQWRSDFKTQVDHCLHDGVRGKSIVERLRPGDGDYFVLKPKHSGFFSTSLDVLLESLGSKTLILAGIAANICVLFTANDAYMRDYKLIVPSDAVAANTPELCQFALRQMASALKARTPSVDELILSRELENAPTQSTAT